MLIKKRRSENTTNGPRPRTAFLRISFLSQTRTVTPRERKSVPSSRNVRKTLINVIRKILTLLLSPRWKQSYTSREYKVLKESTKDKENTKYSTKDYRRNSREVNLLETEAAHQRAKYVKYKIYKQRFCQVKDPQRRYCHYRWHFGDRLLINQQGL